jgi:hypothetical protein
MEPSGRYGDAPREYPATRRVAFVGGPWDAERGDYYGIDGFPEMMTTGGSYVFSDVDDDGEVIYYFFSVDST